MRVRAGKDYPINTLRLYLDSAHTNRRLVSREFGWDDPYGEKIKIPNECVIEFSDSRELDLLIDALTTFRDKNRDHFGNWVDIGYGDILNDRDFKRLEHT